MVEPFLKEFLGADVVLGTEIGTYRGRATGLVCRPGVLVGKNKAEALLNTFGEDKPHLGLGDRLTDAPFMALCKVTTFLSSFTTHIFTFMILRSLNVKK